MSSPGNIGIGVKNSSAKLQVVGLSKYADNAATKKVGLTAGALYRTSDLLKVVR